IEHVDVARPAELIQEDDGFRPNGNFCGFALCFRSEEVWHGQAKQPHAADLQQVPPGHAALLQATTGKWFGPVHVNVSVRIPWNLTTPRLNLRAQLADPWRHQARQSPFAIRARAARGSMRSNKAPQQVYCWADPNS